MTKLVCSNCEYDFREVRGIDGTVKAPTQDDVTVCPQCLALLVHKEGKFREMTDEELFSLPDNERMQMLRVQKLLKNKNFMPPKPETIEKLSKALDDIAAKAEVVLKELGGEVGLVVILRDVSKEYGYQGCVTNMADERLVCQSLKAAALGYEKPEKFKEIMREILGS